MSAVLNRSHGDDLPEPLRSFISGAVVHYEPKYKDQVVEIAKEMHETSMFRDYSLDADKLISQLELADKHPDTAYFRIAVRDGEVFGGFYGTISRMFFCDELMARDVGWWVKKNRRGSWAAVRLLAGFEVWAKEKGAKKVMIGQSSEINIEETTRLYKHCGYRVIGFNTIKEL